MVQFIKTLNNKKDVIKMMTEDILEDVLELENQKIISDELILSDTYSESEMFETADPITKHELSSLRHKVSKLIKLNKALNKFGSGFVDKETGKLNNNMEADWEHEYHYLSPEEFERAKGGVCWDYAEYQFRVLKKSGYDVINFYLEFNDPMSCNHAFTVVKFRGFYIYMESSYKKIAGIYVTKHVCDIFTYILNSIMLNYNLKNVNYVIHSYPGYDNYGCDVYTFMNHMVNEEKLIAKGYINHQLTTPGDLRRIDERFDESADDSGSGDSEDTGYRYEKLTKSSDISTFYKNFKDVFGEDASENGSDPSKYMKAIYLEDELIGYVGFSKYTIKNKKYLGLGNFMVLRKYQSNGHGSAIIKDIIGKYKTTYDQIYCYVDPKNTRALNFYKKIGKVDTSHENEEGYYYVIFYDKTTHYNEAVSDIYTEDEDGENRAVRKASLSIHTHIPEKYKKHLRLSDESTGIVYYKTVTDEIPIGFVNTEEKSNGVWIQALEVFDGFRHQGYGRRLMIDAMNAYNAKYLSVRKTNKVAIDLYKSLGFVVIDETDYMYAMSTVGKKEKVFEEDWSESDSENILEELLLFEGAIEHSFLLKKVVEESIFTVLATPEGRRKYKRIQDEYINRNMEKLSTAGPMYLIVFGDNDQKAYFDLFRIKKEDIREAMTEITKKAGANSDFKFLRQNPILVVLYFCIRYFTIENDKQGVNATLAIFALGIYWSKFTKYFPKGVIVPVMEYTIDNMTEKFMIKKCGNIFNTLVTSINQSYQFHKKRFYEGGDDDVVAFMQRISNDQNSLLKKIANEYMKNYKEGKAVTTRNDDYDPDNPIVDDVQNASTIIQNQVSKVTLPIISNGVDLVLAEASARMAGISISDCREYLVKIMVPENLNNLESLIESILFMFIYTYGRSVRDIKSQYFLVWARALFKKTNSKDENLRNINSILEKWAEESGIYARYKREGSRINYKKGIFFYVILAIQKYS